MAGPVSRSESFGNDSGGRSADGGRRPPGRLGATDRRLVRLQVHRQARLHAYPNQISESGKPAHELFPHVDGVASLRGLLFYRLVEQALRPEAAPYKTLIKPASAKAA